MSYQLDQLAQTIVKEFELDRKVCQYMSNKVSNQLSNYLCNNETFKERLFQLEQQLKSTMLLYREEHRKSLSETIKTVKVAELLLQSNDFESAIKLFGKAIKTTPHNLPQNHEYNLANLYGKRSVVLFLCNSIPEAEFDMNICAQLDKSIASVYLRKANEMLHTEMAMIRNSANELNQLEKSITRLQWNMANNFKNGTYYSEESNVDDEFVPKVKFDRKQLSLWFDNRAKGKCHPNGAHFLCAKSDLNAGIQILDEEPLRIFSAKPHPLGAILFQIYSRLVMNPEYSTENDLVDRVSLSTDADLFFAGRENLAQLPKRSYQYRYYLLSNEDAGRKTFSCNHKLIAFEAMLALRESADNKDEILPIIASTKLIEQVLIESLQVMFALDINNNSIKESFEMDHFRLLSIIEDYKRLYRLNSAQGIVPEGIKSSLPHFVQPIIGTFFWPGCSANVKMTLCPISGRLFYTTCKPVKKYEKLIIQFPTDYIEIRNGKFCKCIPCTKSRQPVASSKFPMPLPQRSSIQI
ncbi:hypothetical protein RDWZM_009144 [Blomia tropicalis]|uniref:Uncharacterized protein n=1 Tax=Blomia tropicalis TaxID=40697 RepID=A0A9Q0M320_BLOTA|nr:hypothetical protein RDWZM_009144 [Blomia tropicalis]